MEKLPGAQFLLPMHPECAQYKTLISNTVIDDEEPIQNGSNSWARAWGMREESR